MNVSSVSHPVAVLPGADVGEAVKVEVLRRTNSIAKQHAQQMLEGVPKASSNPPHLGQTIDTHV